MSIDLGELAAAIGQLTLRFRLRRRTAADWTSTNEILLSAEAGLESDTGRLKIGDGATPWNSLDYFGGDILGPENAGPAIAITNATHYPTLAASATVVQQAADPAAGNRLVVWVKWAGYPSSDSQWAPPAGTTFYIYASRRPLADSTGAVSVNGKVSFTASVSYGPDDTTRYTIVGGGGGASGDTGLTLAATAAGVDIRGYHRSDNNLPSDACADWSAAPAWANWAITLPLGQGGVFQPNPGDGQPVPDYGEWALYGESLPGDSAAPAGSARQYFSPTTVIQMLKASGFQKTISTPQAQITQIDFGRAIAAGQVLTVTVGSTVYTYEVTNASTGLSGMAAGINSDASGVVTASVSGTLLVLTGKQTGAAHPFTASGSSVGVPMRITNTGVRSIVGGSNITVDNSDPYHPIVSASGGGSGGVTDVPAQLNAALINALASAPPVTVAGSDTGNFYDMSIHVTIGGIDYYILVLGRLVRGDTAVAGTNARVTVPSGKTARFYSAMFDTQTGGNNWAFYKSDLYNLTTAQTVVGPPNSGAPFITPGTQDSLVSPTNPGRYIPNSANSAVTVPLTTNFTPTIAQAGETVAARVAGNPDSNTRTTTAIYVVMIS